MTSTSKDTKPPKLCRCSQVYCSVCDDFLEISPELDVCPTDPTRLKCPYCECVDPPPEPRGLDTCSVCTVEICDACARYIGGVLAQPYAFLRQNVCLVCYKKYRKLCEEVCRDAFYKFRDDAQEAREIELARKRHAASMRNVTSELLFTPEGRLAGLPLGGIEYQRQKRALGELCEH
jgi:hypothetical protein